VKQTKENLKKAKELLELKRTDFLHLWVKSLQYKEMSRILDTIVELQITQETLDAFINEKKYTRAVNVYRHADKTIYANDISEIGALENIRIQLKKKKEELKDALVSELQNQLYLKNISSFQRIGKEV
jgi:exocyst complex component 4